MRGQVWIAEEIVRLEALKEERRKQEEAAKAKAKEDARKEELRIERKREQAAKAEEQLRKAVQAARVEEQRKRKQAELAAAEEEARRRNPAAAQGDDEDSADRAFGGKAGMIPALKLHGPRPRSNVWSVEEPFVPKTLKDGKPEALSARTARSLKGTPHKSGEDQTFVRSMFLLHVNQSDLF
jgi:hypothetical protein